MAEHKYLTAEEVALIKRLIVIAKGTAREMEYFWEERLISDLEAMRDENQKNLDLWDADAQDKQDTINDCIRGIRQRDKKLDRLRKALEEIAADDWGHAGGRVIYGNESIGGDAGEFYKGYNAGVKTQFAKSQSIAHRALNPQPTEAK